MKHKQLITFGSVLVLVILLATACASIDTPKITITFSADEKCIMEGPNTIPADKNIPIEVIGNLKGHGTVGVGIARIDPDKTLKDLQDSDFEVEPPWVQRIAFYEFPSDSRSYSIDLNVTEGPIYFVCFYESPATKIGALGPIQVEE